MNKDKCPKCGADIPDENGWGHRVDSFGCYRRQLDQANAKIAELQAVVDKLRKETLNETE